MRDTFDIDHDASASDFLTSNEYGKMVTHMIIMS